MSTELTPTVPEPSAPPGLDGPARPGPPLGRVVLRCAMAALVAAAITCLLGRWAGVNWAACLGRLQGHWATAAGCLALSGVFLACKAMALRRSAGRAGIELSWPAAVRLFAEGTVIELGTWPGKLWADGYRAAVMPGGAGAGARVRAVGGFRLATMAAMGLLLAPSLVALGASFHLALGGAAVGLLVAGAWLGRRRLGGLKAWRHGAMAALPWAIPAAVADVTAAAWLGAALAGVGPLAMAAWYVAGGALGALAQLPLGLGLSDACTWAGMTRLGGQPSAVMAVVVCTRLLGAGCTVLAGLASLALRSVAAGFGPQPARRTATG